MATLHYCCFLKWEHYQKTAIYNISKALHKSGYYHNNEIIIMMMMMILMMMILIMMKVSNLASYI